MTLDALLGAAMLACDFHGDGDAARAEMRGDCIALPADQRADLHAHFTKAYGAHRADELAEPPWELVVTFQNSSPSGGSPSGSSTPMSVDNTEGRPAAHAPRSNFN